MNAPARWLLPFRAGLLSGVALARALEEAGAVGATLVPAYLALMAPGSSDDAPLPRECADAMPLLEVVDQLAARAGVEVETRIERGHDLRDSLQELLAHERYERVLVALRTGVEPGLEPADVDWLREHASAPVVVLAADA